MSHSLHLYRYYALICSGKFEKVIGTLAQKLRDYLGEMPFQEMYLSDTFIMELLLKYMHAVSHKGKKKKEKNHVVMIL